MAERRSRSLPQTEKVPLVVDLDGTLIRTDMLYETAAAAFKRQPWSVWQWGAWMLRGRWYLKERLAEVASWDPALLPYRPEVLAALEKAREEGRPIVLATGSARAVAERVAEHLGGFAGVGGSGEGRNLTGARKAAWLVECYGEGGYDYIGDSRKDGPVWQSAREVLLAGSSASARRQALQAKHGRLRELREDTDATLARGLKLWAKQLRLHQWAKNLLVFLPLLAAHAWFDPVAWLHAVVAFLSMGLCASAVYVLNDWLDLEADRQHPVKRHRPLASGRISAGKALLFVPGGMLSGIGLAFIAGLPLVLGLLCYLLLTTAYSLRLKSLAVVDVLVLAGLYTLRIILGGLACGIAVSTWLLAFSLFFFLSLGSGKRFAELLAAPPARGESLKGRGYVGEDVGQVRGFGISAAYMSVLVMALYITNEKSSALYGRPELLWGICLLLLYWLSRFWLLTGRGQMQDDPVLFAIRDRQTYVVGLLAVGVALLAKFV